MFQRARRRLIVPFIAPQLVLYVLVVFVPLALTVYYGFTDWQGHGNAIHWAGLRNYRILLEDDNFHNAVGNSIRLTLIGGVVLFIPALYMAWSLHQPIRGRRPFQFVILAPIVIAAIAREMAAFL